MVYLARSGAGMGVAVGISVGMMVVSVGGTAVGVSGKLSACVGAGVTVPQAARKRTRRIEEKEWTRFNIAVF